MSSWFSCLAPSRSSLKVYQVAVAFLECQQDGRGFIFAFFSFQGGIRGLLLTPPPPRTQFMPVKFRAPSVRTL